VPLSPRTAGGLPREAPRIRRRGLHLPRPPRIRTDPALRDRALGM